MKKEIILVTGITSCVIGLILMFYIAFKVTRAQTVVKMYNPDPCEYHFTVDGTDSLNLYSIYSSDGSLIVEGIPSSLIDSVINADNE